jgi:hypothetical protein
VGRGSERCQSVYLHVVRNSRRSDENGRGSQNYEEFPRAGSWTVARKKTSKVRVNVKASLSRRLREIRQEIFGDHGGPELARRLSLPIEQTGANPIWLLTGEGPRYRRSSDERLLSQLSPVELIRRGLEELERSPSSMVVVAAENLPTENASEFVAVGLCPFSEIGSAVIDPSRLEGYVLAYRQWLPNPNETIATRLTDDAMHPILPAGSIVAIDRSVTDPQKLHGQIVAARPEGVPMIRWLDLSGRHVILRPNQTNGRDFPLIPVDASEADTQLIIGQVVWSWSRFGKR